jgi:hypothetical protein
MNDPVITASTLELHKSGMNPIYFETHFESLEEWDDWPVEFAIITGYATTGESWPIAKNKAADLQLEADLRKQGRWVRRLTGYSPTSSHQEPGWAVELSLSTACDVGLQYKQDAIYFIIGDKLSVSFCDSRRALVEVGTFRQRVHFSGF